MSFSVLYMTEWTPRLLLILARNLMRLLFESGVYSIAVSISFSAGNELKRNSVKKIIFIVMVY